MPIYSEGTQPYQAPLSSPVGLEPYGEILALRKMMEGGESALHDAEQAAATVGSAVTAANQAASNATAAANAARSAATVASEKASAADTAATQASSAADNANAAATRATNAEISANHTVASVASSLSRSINLANDAAATATTAADRANVKAALANEKAALADEKAALVDERVNAATEAIINANTARNQAFAAAEEANQKAFSAQAAANDARSAIQYTRAARDNANAAANSANRAASVAAAAANSANEKAALANEKAGAATEATVNANTARNQALAAAEEANQKAFSAQAAANDARSATQSANAARDNANEKANRAFAAAGSAIDAAGQANDAAATATSAANSATAAANLANSKASAADAAAQQATDAASSVEDVVERAEDAIEAMGDISELAVPLMSADTRGGAKLGDGLAVDDGTLHVGQLAKASTGEVYGPLASVTAKGHAEQVSTTGKNLAFKTISGASINSNGTITVASGVNAKDIMVARVESGVTYTATVSDSPDMFVYAYYATEPYVSSESIDGTRTVDSNAKTSHTFTATYDGFVAVRCTYGFEYPQLELGSTATEYEPYTGGAPSPSPDYPQEIQVVRGRNLLDFDACQIAAFNGTYTASNGTYTFTPSSVPSQYGRIDFNFPNIKSGTYTFTFNRSIVDTTIRIGHSEGADDTNYDSSIVYISSGNSYTFTYEEGTKQFIRISIYFGKSSGEVSNLQLTEGSTPQPYMPYGHVGLEVQGKNLLPFPYKQSNSTSNGITYEVLPDGGIHMYGTATARTDFHIAETNVMLPIYQQYKGQDLTLSGLPTGGSDNTYSLRFQINGAAIGDNGRGFVTRTVPTEFNESEPQQIYTIINQGVTVDFTVYPQLELGSTATDYEPYINSTTPIPLPQRGWVGGLPDGTADVLSIDSAGKVEWVKNTKMEMFDSSSTGFVYTASGGRGYVSLFIPDKLNTGATLQTNFLCDKLRAGVNFEWCLYSYNANIITMVPDTITTATEVHDALVPFTLLYPLATPVTEECGYVDLPDIPSEATVSIPELEELGMTFWVDGDGTIRAAMRDWYERAHSEYADRLTALEEAVASLVTQ